jgi:hypothetical protein
MGEAKRRAEAHAAAIPHRPPRVCPRCKSIRITRVNQTGTPYDVCRACGTVWEAYPEDWCEDVVGASPCDNCAYRPGSPEQKDAKGWKQLIATLRAGGEFRCHKGAPIHGLLGGAPNPDGSTTVEFDAEWVQRHGRKCAGFIRMVWAMEAKGEDWLARHYEFCGAPGYDLPLGDEQQ